MFGISGFELFIILLFGFLIFGPEKLPDIANTVGRAIGRFRSAQEEMNEVIKPTDIYDPNDKEAPFKDPTIALDKLAKHQEEKRAKEDAAKGKDVSGAKAAAAADTAKPAESAESASASDAPAAERPRESFSERKARYERERAARKAAEAEAGAESEGGDR